MSDLAVSVEGLSKSYLVGHTTTREERYSTLRDTLTRNTRNLVRKTRDMVSGRPLVQGDEIEEFWALKDVSFNIKRGERVGIIGRNGAGKSTLLKVLSRITEPTRGRVRIAGRVASLLEVGTGFHPELTGRENIFLNGAILGMTRKDIQLKFDEIVNFSEVERFLDTPVKRYSSGMYVRLAFAVAAHLEPEILIVDEVLAVGDAPFQRKCLGKMETAGSEGRTVIFVSHNMGALRNLCETSIWMEGGCIHRTGSTSEVVESYLGQSLNSDSLAQLQETISALPNDPTFKLDGVNISQAGKQTTTVLNGHSITVEIRFTVLQRTTGLRVYFDLCDEERNILIRTFNDDDNDVMSVMAPGSYRAYAVIPADLLAPRTYELRFYGTIFNVKSIPVGGIGISLHVQMSNGMNRAYPLEPIRSKLLPRIPWVTEST